MSFIKREKLKCDFYQIYLVSMQSFLILFLSSIFVLLHSSTASLKEKESTIVDLFQVIKSEKPTAPNKKALRYGFHRTKECQEFELAFLCVQKCTDLGYDIAHADKNCVCTCFRDRIKAQYTNKNKSNVTRWRLGAPTTKLPLWAQTETVTQEPNEELSENEDSKSVEKSTVSDGSPVDGNGNASGNETAVTGAGANATDAAAAENETVADKTQGGKISEAGDGAAGNATNGDTKSEASADMRSGKNSTNTTKKAPTKAPAGTPSKNNPTSTKKIARTEAPTKAPAGTPLKKQSDKY